MFLRKITLFGLGVEATINGSSGACDFSGAQGVWVFNGAVDSELSLHVETRQHRQVLHICSELLAPLGFRCARSTERIGPSCAWDVPTSQGGFALT